jgi:hypothetical protein
MRNSIKMLLRIIAPLAVVGAVVLTPSTVLADEIEQLKLVINIHDDSLMGKSDAQDIAKAVDDILKQCDQYGIRMRVTPEIRTGVTEVAGETIPGENVTDAQEIDINKAGEKEVKDGGYKMTVVDSFANSNTNGSTTRKNNAPMPASTVDDDMSSDTWVHELGHGLGLEHETDTDNVMHGVKKNRTGTELTEDQCRELKDGFRERGAEKRCSEGQQTQGDCTPGTESVNDAAFDPTGDTPNPIVDLEAALFTFDLDPVTPSLFTAVRVGLFPEDPVTVTYEIGFDTDNDHATGGPVGLFPGFDYEVLVEATGTFPFVGTATASLIKLPEGVPMIPLDDPEFVHVFEHVDVVDPPEVPEVEIAAEVALSIPVALLEPLANPMRVVVVAFSAPDEDVLEPEEVNTQPILGPELVLTPRTTHVGDPFDIEGSGFAASSALTLLLANEVLEETTTLGDGTFSTLANTPPKPAGHYLVDAIDAEGNIGLEVVTITTLPVGGAAQLPGASDSSGPNYALLAAVIAAALVALTAGAWYARRRWLG